MFEDQSRAKTFAFNATKQQTLLFLGSLCLLCLLVAAPLLAEDKEEQTEDKPNFKTLYINDFSEEEALEDFVFTDKAAWRWAKVEGKNAMELHGKSKYEPPYRSPHNIALVRGKAFGDFDLELDLMQTGKEYGHRDLCIFFGFQDPANYYYAHIATAADAHAHSVFLVDDAARKSICDDRTKGVDWGKQEWKKVRIERRVKEGTIKVFFDDMTKPVMTTKDTTHGQGMIGLGSFDDTGAVKLIKVMGTEVKAVAKKNPFEKAEKQEEE